jgi:hypothetical protein
MQESLGGPCINGPVRNSEIDRSESRAAALDVGRRGSGERRQG